MAANGQLLNPRSVLMKNNRTHWKIVGILGITQIASWGSMFYAFSLLASEIQRAGLAF